MRNFKPVRSGFSLIELLTVIAIIAILAAILFPVFSRVREKSRQTNCISNMHELYVAMRLYREDNNKYPASLLGFAQKSGFVPKVPADSASCSTSYDPANDTTDHCFYLSADANTSPISIPDLTYKPLFNSQKYLKGHEPFVCPDSTSNDPRSLSPNAVTTAGYPPNVPLTGKPVIYTKLIKDNCCRLVPDETESQPIYFYKYDSYDIGPALDMNGKALKNLGQTVWELHYALDWTGDNGPMDAPNQLKYPDAPEDKTVVTWCTYHAAIAGSDMTLVMMLSGKARPVNAKEFYNKGPLGLAP